MSIVFALLESGTPGPSVRSGFGASSLRLEAIGRGTALGHGHGYGRAIVDGFITTSIGPGRTSGTPDGPEIPAYAAGVAAIVLAAIGAGNQTVHGTGVASLSLRARGYGVSSHGVAEIALAFSAHGVAPGFVAPPDDPSDVVSALERIGLGGSIGFLDVAVIFEALAMRITPSTRLNGISTMRDALTFEDALTLVYYTLVIDGFVFSDSVQSQRAALERCVERLLLTGQVGSLLEAIDTLIVGIAFGVIAESVPVASAADQLALGADLQSTIAAVVRALDGLALSVADRGEYTATVLVRESMSLGEALAISADLHTLVRESIGFLATLTLDTGEYIAWVLNTESKGLSTYDNFPFNSFAKIGERYYGCAADGIYCLEGKDDDGQQIHWRIRTAMTDMGTRLLKRIPEAFFTIATDGQIYVQVVTVDENGDKAACIYRMNERSGVNRRENRQTFGRGLKSIDWAMVLEDADGATLDLTGAEWRPLMLDRRTRG